VRELDPADFPPTQLPEVFLDLLLNRHINETSFQSAIAQSFVREILPALFTERRLRAFALFEDEGIIGIDLCLMGDNSLCGWNSGFLATAAHWSPGTLLTDAGIRQAFAMSLEEYDFMRGDEAYKASWTNGSRPIGEIEFTL
jgi:CelD/BcsL family acetyltransferase involved in cellulose biosynthesis